MDNSPCEYCGAALPFGVDKLTRRIRSHHFQNCSMRPQHKEVEQFRREWVSLTEEDIKSMYDNCDADTGHAFVFAFARAIEAALRSKNHG
jgi:hypothetical protein